MVESFRQQGFACLRGERRTRLQKAGSGSTEIRSPRHHGDAVFFIGVQTVAYLQNNFACFSDQSRRSLREVHDGQTTAASMI
jgi:hypothetical protein